MVQMQKRTGFQLMVAFGIWLNACVSGEAQRLTWLGTLDSVASGAFGVSVDGSVVVGRIGVPPPGMVYWRAFRWTRSGGMQDLGTLGGGWSGATGVSADGSVVVGWARNASGQDRAFRWENGVMQDLGTLGGDWSMAYGVSADGSVVVGTAVNARGQQRAFRWENGVMQELSTPDRSESRAHGVSADGSVIVGSVGSHAFRWVNGVMQDLGTLPGGYWSEAWGVSVDGSVVVGKAFSNLSYHLFRWTASGGMQDLGTLGGSYGGLARGVSANGLIVVGWSYNVNDHARAVRWTASGGLEDLNQTYASLLTNGSLLEGAYAISPDGRYIVGEGYNTATGRYEAFLLDTWRTGDTNGDGCIDDQDLLAVLFAFGTPGTGYTRHEDINKDGIVDDADLLEVLFNFGQGC